MRKLITGIFVILCFCQAGFAQIFKNITELGPFNAQQRSTALHIDYTNPKKWYLGTDGGGLWVSEDSGANWKKQDPKLGGNIRVITQDVEQPKHIYYLSSCLNYGSTNPGIYRSKNGGISFQLLVGGENQVIKSWQSFRHMYVSHKQVYLQNFDGIYKVDAEGAVAQLTSPLPFTNYQDRYEGLTVIAKNTTEDFILASTTDKVYLKQGTGNFEIVLTEPNSDKIFVAHCKNSPNVVYAITSVNKLVKRLYKSQNYGIKGSWEIAYEFQETETWRPSLFWQQFAGLYVDPQNPDIVMIISTEMHLSTNGGKSWKKQMDSHFASVGEYGSEHRKKVTLGDMWPGAIAINPLNGKWVLGHDHGLFEGTEEELFVNPGSSQQLSPTILDKTKGVAAFTSYVGSYLDNHSNAVVISGQDRGAWFLKDGKEIYLAGGDVYHIVAENDSTINYLGNNLTVISFSLGGKPLFFQENKVRPYYGTDLLVKDSRGYLYYGNDANYNNQGFAIAQSKDHGKTFSDIYTGDKPIIKTAVHPLSQQVYFLENGKLIKKIDPVTKKVTPLFDANQHPELRFFDSIELDPTNENIVYAYNNHAIHLYRININDNTYQTINNNVSNYPKKIKGIENPIHSIAVKNDSLIFVGTRHGIFYTSNQGKSWAKQGFLIKN